MTTTLRKLLVATRETLSEQGTAAPSSSVMPAVAAVLNRVAKSPAGSFSAEVVRTGNEVIVSVEPRGRQRLDHYGNDGEGWDEYAWQEKYAGPLTAFVQKKLEAEFGKAQASKLYVDVDTKGYVIVGAYLNEAVLDEVAITAGGTDAAAEVVRKLLWPTVTNLEKYLASADPQAINAGLNMVLSSVALLFDQLKKKTSAALIREAAQKLRD